MVTVALAGDTMLGRGVGQRLAEEPFEAVVAPDVRELTAGADLCLVNLECCVSDRGVRWPAPGKPFFFRAPPRAADALAWLGVDCVTLANNHALDYGPDALYDTLAHLADAGIAAVGAGADVDQARRWRVLTAAGLRLGVLGVTDHPADFAAAADRPGVAYADLWTGVPDWLRRQVAAMGRQVDAALVSPHWGPNMTTRPLPHVRAAARAFLAAGADLVAGHSAHVVHGVAGPVLFDLGDFVDDYAVDRRLRNDLGLLFLIDIDASGPAELRAVPLAHDRCRTRLADPAEAGWLRRRFVAACAEWGTEVAVTGQGRLAVPLR
ncbi:MAG TPA: CapA family protein [Planosporangium sp.]|jgi:poly-gamma-glutamate synthesis protein (capsule biosynthesis protein)|nr:CapA family protein [Planosporangium sp.]